MPFKKLAGKRLTALRYISSARFLASCSFSKRFLQLSSLRVNVSMQLDRENNMPLAVAYKIIQKLSHHTILKVNFLSKNSILTKNPTHFHEFFTPKFFDNFSREIKVVNS